MNTIFVINPNSTAAVTAAIDKAVTPLRGHGRFTIESLGLAGGPSGIQSQRDVDGIVDPLCRRIAELDEQASAFVIACFSDPGLHSARETTQRPVLGVAECGVLTALTLGQRFGVISILPTSIPRHLRYFGAMGVSERLAGDRAIGLGVTDLAYKDRTFSRMLDVGRMLRDTDGADVLVLGCAGMADHRAPLAEALRIPVVEPTQAAVTMALGRAGLGW